MNLTREILEGMPEGAAIGDKWKYTCGWCGRAYTEDVHPSRQEFKRCHRCYTGGQVKPMIFGEWSAVLDEHEANERG